jgi:hypothetical protein
VVEQLLVQPQALGRLPGLKVLQPPQELVQQATRRLVLPQPPASQQLAQPALQQLGLWQLVLWQLEPRPLELRQLELPQLELPQLAARQEELP